MDTIRQESDKAGAVQAIDDVASMASQVKPRRRFSVQYKRQIVEETLSGETSVSLVARQHDINANQVFKWRREYQQGLFADKYSDQPLIPIGVTSGTTSQITKSSVREEVPATGRLEITLDNGHRLNVVGPVCRDTLDVVLSSLLPC